MIPLTNISFVIIYTIGGLFQGLVYGYFLHNYLKPKYGKKSFLYYYITFIPYLLIILCLLYEEIFIRTLFTIFFLTLSAFLFYTGNKIKIVLVGALLYTISGIAEILSQFIIVFIFQHNIFETLPNHLLIIILLTAILFMFIIENIFLTFSHKNFNFNTKFSNILICLSFQGLLISIVLSYGSYSNGLLSPQTFSFNVNHIFLIIVLCFIMTIFLIMYMIRALYKLKQSISKELIIQSIYQQNIEQLQQYLDSKDKENTIAQLRHDVINYLQTMNTIKENQNNE